VRVPRTRLEVLSHLPGIVTKADLPRLAPL
jgi:hypothetical protein